MATAKQTLRPRNRALNEALLARSRGGGSGAHRDASEKRRRNRLDREVAQDLREDAYSKAGGCQD